MKEQIEEAKTIIHTVETVSKTSAERVKKILAELKEIQKDFPTELRKLRDMKEEMKVLAHALHEEKETPEVYAKAAKHLREVVRDPNVEAHIAGIPPILLRTATALHEVSEKLAEKLTEGWNDLQEVHNNLSSEAYLQLAINHLQSAIENLEAAYHLFYTMGELKEPKEEIEERVREMENLAA